MPIARQMPPPDGAPQQTPVGGDLNGTAATPLFHQAGTAASFLGLPRFVGAQNMGIPGAVAPLNAMALDELEETTQQEDSAKAELAQARAEEAQEDAGPTEPAGEPARDKPASRVLERNPTRSVQGQRSRDTRHKP